MFDRIRAHPQNTELRSGDAVELIAGEARCKVIDHSTDNPAAVIRAPASNVRRWALWAPTTYVRRLSQPSAAAMNSIAAATSSVKSKSSP